MFDGSHRLLKKRREREGEKSRGLRYIPIVLIETEGFNHTMPMDRFQWK